jgi:hypothetical protein
VKPALAHDGIAPSLIEDEHTKVVEPSARGVDAAPAGRLTGIDRKSATNTQTGANLPLMRNLGGHA